MELDTVINRPSSILSSSSSSSLLASNGPVSESRVEAEEAIDRLNRLSTSIRRAGVHHRDAKAESYIDRDENGQDLTALFKEYAKTIIKHRIPKAHNALQARMAESIALRRNRFAYLQRHQQKLSYQQPETQHSLEAIREEYVIEEQSESRALPKPEISRQQPIEVPSPSDTSATVPAPEKIRIRPFSSSGSTIISKNSFRMGNLDIKPPKLFQNNVFECPYCLILCPAKEAHGKHWQ